jgi:hypothetical protein
VPAASPILPDTAVDGLVADAELSAFPEPSGDLLGTPLLHETGHHHGPVLGPEVLIAPGTGASAASELVSRRRSIPSVIAPVARISRLIVLG